METFTIDQDVFLQVFVHNTTLELVCETKNLNQKSNDNSASQASTSQSEDNKISLNQIRTYIHQKLTEIGSLNIPAGAQFPPNTPGFASGCNVFSQDSSNVSTNDRSTNTATAAGTTNLLQMSVDQNLLNVQKEMNSLLGPNHAYAGNRSEQVRRSSSLDYNSNARIGPKRVQFDNGSRVGVMHSDSMTGTLISKSNFASIRANVCIFAGKWQYEVMLNTRGIMQLGWASCNCKFTNSKGVGDTTNSFAFDGCRVKRWNQTALEYGESWQVGDVIGVCIDLDEGLVRYSRNGRDLGTAFEHITLGPGMAYFPAISLSQFESVVVNFGASPFRYPFFGYSPLEHVQPSTIMQANLLIEWLFNLVLLKVKNRNNSDVGNDHRMDTSEPFGDVNTANEQSSNSGSNLDKISPNLIAYLIFERLSSLLSSLYIVEACLLKHLLLYHNNEEIHCLLDLCWTLLEESQMSQILNHFVQAIVNGYKFSPICDEDALLSELNNLPMFEFTAGSFGQEKRAPFFLHQKQHLLLFLAFMQHNRTRTCALENILFKHNSLVELLEIRPISDLEVLRTKIFPHLTVQQLSTYFDSKTMSDPLYLEETIKPVSNDHRFWKNPHLDSWIQELEALQNLILDTLIFQDEHCRKIFVEKFGSFLSYNIGYINGEVGISTSFPNTISTPFPVLLSVFHRLISLIRNQYENVIQFLPIDYHLNFKVDAVEVSRIGGSFNHLSKTYKKEMINYKHSIERNGRNPLLAQVHLLLDNLIRLYSAAPHKQLEKYNSLKEVLLDFGGSLANLNRAQSSSDDVDLDPYRNEKFDHSRNILCNEFLLRSSHFAMVNSVVFSTSRRSDLIWLLRILLNTLENASSLGCLLSFLPDYYLEACLNLCFALRFYFCNENIKVDNPFLNSSRPATTEQRSEYIQVLRQFCTFVSLHLYDERVALSDHKALISHSLASLILYKQSLHILENISIESRLNLIKKLTLPYDNSPSWVDSNWTLLRFWKGSGFAYRQNASNLLKNTQTIDSLPNGALLDKKIVLSNMNSVHPLPSLAFQQLLSDYFNSNRQNAHLFLSSLLNKLNWTFSQCISTLQEIQAYSVNPDRQQTDANQAKLCCACFELVCALLRCLEMILHYNAQLILQYDPNSECKDQMSSDCASSDMDKKRSKHFSLLGSTAFDDQIQDFQLNELLNRLSDKVHQMNENESYLNEELADLGGLAFPQTSGGSITKNSEAEEQRRLEQKCENEVLLHQLCCTLNQVLNRVTMGSSYFAYIQQVAGVKMINEFSILSAVSAILTELIVNNERTRNLTLHMLVSEPSFQLQSYLYMIGGQAPKLKSRKSLPCTVTGSLTESDHVASGSGSVSAKTNSKNSKLKFHFADHSDDLKSEEFEQINKMLIYLSRYHERNERNRQNEEINDDDICTICYAQRKTARFVPCNHQSCKMCITMHFTRNHECFFCKCVLEKVLFDDSTQILYPKNDKVSAS